MCTQIQCQGVGIVKNKFAAYCVSACKCLCVYMCVSVRARVQQTEEIWHQSSLQRQDSVLQCVAVCCSVLQWFAVCCSVLQCVTVCCSVLQWPGTSLLFRGKAVEVGACKSSARHTLAILHSFTCKWESSYIWIGPANRAHLTCLQSCTVLCMNESCDIWMSEVIQSTTHSCNPA